MRVTHSSSCCSIGKWMLAVCLGLAIGFGVIPLLTNRSPVSGEASHSGSAAKTVNPALVQLLGQYLQLPSDVTYAERIRVVEQLLKLAQPTEDRSDVVSTDLFELVIARLNDCGTLESHLEIGRLLDLIKLTGVGHPRAITSVASLLEENSPVYRERDKLQVHSLRGYSLAVLSEIDGTVEAWPHVVDMIVNADNGQPGIGSAAAARSAGNLGESANALIPHLVQLFDMEFSDNLVCLESYNGCSPDHSLTSVQKEAIVAIGKILPSSDHRVIGILERYTRDDAMAFGLQSEARAAINSIKARGHRP